MGRIQIGLLVVMTMVACRTAEPVPEKGAILLKVSCTAGAPNADELRAWVYDDGGVLWSGVRLEGSQVVGCDRPGTVLIQPGAFRGTLRVHLRAFAAQARVLDGVLSIASLAGSRTFSLVLDPAVPADGDGDDVPDLIDDCPAVPDPAQSGCPGPDGSSLDAPAPDAVIDAPVLDLGSGDAAADSSAASCDAAVCDLPQGAQCADNAECASGSCADGVCCTNACLGACRSCNQPSATGVCQGYASSTDPEGECSGGTTCNGVGACGPGEPTNKTNGQLCTAAGQCASGFCTDGVCCDSACTSACQTCGSGTCVAVSRTDDIPECTGNTTCNPKGRCVTK